MTCGWPYHRCETSTYVADIKKKKDLSPCRCNRQCRSTGHYHCPYCAKTIIQKECMKTDMFGCQSEPPPLLTLTPHLLSSASQLCIPACLEISKHPCPLTITCTHFTTLASPNLPGSAGSIVLSSTSR